MERILCLVGTVGMMWNGPWTSDTNPTLPQTCSNTPALQLSTNAILKMFHTFTGNMNTRRVRLRDDLESRFGGREASGNRYLTKDPFN